MDMDAPLGIFIIAAEIPRDSGLTAFGILGEFHGTAGRGRVVGARGDVATNEGDYICTRQRRRDGQPGLINLYMHEFLLLVVL